MRQARQFVLGGLVQPGPPLAGFSSVSSLLNGLLAWYKLNEAQGNSRADSSGNGNTLTENGGGVPSATGLIGNAAGPFSTTNLSTAGAIVTAAPFAFSCFVNPTSLSGLRKIAIGQGSISIQQGIDVNVGGSADFCVSNANAVTSATALIANGSWTHLAMNYDGTTIKGYINGVLQGTGAKTAGSFNTVFNVGGAGAGAVTFNGLVDLAGAWNRTLTDGGAINVGDTAGGEIASLYNAGSGRDYPFA